MLNKIYCKDCFQWQVTGKWRRGKRGECRCYAPRPELQTWLNFTKVLWPITREDEWCAKAVRDL